MMLLRQPLSWSVSATLAMSLAGCTVPGKPVRAFNSPSAGLSVIDISPAEGSPVSKETVVVVTLEYSVATPGQGKYFVLGQVEKEQIGHTTDGSFPPDDYPILDRPTGRLTFSFPLKYISTRRDVKHPLILWFFLNKDTGAGNSTILASAGPIHYMEP